MFQVIYCWNKFYCNLKRKKDKGLEKKKVVGWFTFLLTQTINTISTVHTQATLGVMNTIDHQVTIKQLTMFYDQQSSKISNNNNFNILSLLWLLQTPNFSLRNSNLLLGKGFVNILGNWNLDLPYFKLIKPSFCTFLRENRIVRDGNCSLITNKHFCASFLL